MACSWDVLLVSLVLSLSEVCVQLNESLLLLDAVRGENCREIFRSGLALSAVEAAWFLFAATLDSSGFIVEETSLNVSTRPLSFLVYGLHIRWGRI